METGNRENSSSVPSAKKGSTAAPVNVIDWAGVEKAYCGTRQSTRDIGKAFGISHTMVAKHAAAKGWVRPSKDQIPNPPPRKGTAEPEPRHAAPKAGPRPPRAGIQMPPPRKGRASWDPGRELLFRVFFLKSPLGWLQF